MKIGNIIYKDELVNHTKQSNINYLNIEDDIHEFDQTLPTLFVGWRFFKENFGTIREKYGVDILEKTIKNDLMYWEFSFDENKSDHINGINDFIISLPRLFFRVKYKYISIDPIKSGNLKIIEEIKNIGNHIDSIYIFKNKYAYMLIRNVVYGLNLEQLRFLINEEYTNEIISFIKDKTNKIFFDGDGEFFKEKLDDFYLHDYLYRYMPIILNT